MRLLAGRPSLAASQSLSSDSASYQGLTLVHFPAQPEPFCIKITLNTP